MSQTWSAQALRRILTLALFVALLFLGLPQANAPLGSRAPAVTDTEAFATCP